VKGDHEIAVDDRGGEVDGQRQRITEAVRMCLDGVQNGRGGDAPERTDHVGPLGLGLSASTVALDGVQA
jgi:hypothetical protein